MDSVIRHGSIYRPGLVLPEDEIAHAFGIKPALKGLKRRVSGFDEDAVTMAHRAASDCLSQGGSVPDHIIFCSNTLPPWPCAPYLLKTLRLSPETPVTIMGGSWRCALDVIALAAQLARNGQKILLIASEMLSTYTLSDASVPFADAAAAMWVEQSSEPHAFKIGRMASASEPFEPLVCLADGRVQVSDDARFTATAVTRVFKAVLGTLDKPQIFGCSTFDPKLSDSIGRIPPLKGIKIVEDPAVSEGYAGCVQPFLLLDRVKAEPGQTVHLGAYGGGVGVISLVAGAVGRVREVSSQKTRTIGGFEKFREVREFMDKSAAARNVFSSQSITHRDQDFLLGLQGVECKECKKIYTIPQALCPSCHSRDSLKARPLSYTGTVFTFTHEFYVPTPMPPVTMLVVDLDRGGRVTVPAADGAGEGLGIGTRVRLVLRRFHAGAGLPNYYWKAVLE